MHASNTTPDILQIRMGTQSAFRTLLFAFTWNKLRVAAWWQLDERRSTIFVCHRLAHALQRRWLLWQAGSVKSVAAGVDAMSDVFNGAAPTASGILMTSLSSPPPSSSNYRIRRAVLERRLLPWQPPRPGRPNRTLGVADSATDLSPRCTVRSAVRALRLQPGHKDYFITLCYY